jgi:peptidoglycan/xylan/chitin deacetylase (PgdA/CDA1 family)
MHLATMGCALAIVVCMGLFGAIVSHRIPLPTVSVLPTPKASTESSGRAVVTRLDTDEVMAAKSAYASDVTPDAQSGVAKRFPGAVAVFRTAPAQAPIPAAAGSLGELQATMVHAGPSCPGNPAALGISRVVEIDTTGGPGFGSEHFKEHDFLREGEVVLTFDDGPWPKHTEAVLNALEAHCTKAIFFPIGLHATYEPRILKQVAAAGHAIGSHTWCHQDLSKIRGTCLVNGRSKSLEYDPKDEIEKGISAVRWAVGGPTAPYFRFPALRHPPELIEYLGKRNIGIFSTDIDLFDFKMRKPEQVRQATLAKLKKYGKGIVLLHDFQHATAEAVAALLNDLKAAGFKAVFMQPRFPVSTIASYDQMILKQTKTSSVEGRPTSSVVRTISE